ncbi:DUF6239 family natural product biosynthesis protein [Micromonospora sp. NPDC007271]|uniref:DUF6239 family natural product biosynthesis protein n=1 Tax=Micromonospora sp. NPDC007271 TaxID=3154587 RepID=UPI0033CF2839
MGHQHGTLELGAPAGSLGVQLLAVAATLLVALLALRRALRAHTEQATAGHGAAGHARPGHGADVAATAAAAAAVPAYLLLADGLSIPHQTVPLLLAATALPVLAVAGRGRVPMRLRAVLGRVAPYTVTGAVAAALLLFATAWLGPDSPEALYTGLLAALIASSWLVLCRPRSALGRAWVGSITVLVAGPMLAATVHADVLATAA